MTAPAAPGRGTSPAGPSTRRRSGSGRSALLIPHTARGLSAAASSARSPRAPPGAPTGVGTPPPPDPPGIGGVGGSGGVAASATGAAAAAAGRSSSLPESLSPLLELPTERRELRSSVGVML